MKHLIIRNFGPIKEVDIELKRINLIIGPQSSGKSTVLKVACFCDWMERQIVLTQDPMQFCNAKAFVNNLTVFHKLTGYMHDDTFIRYENDAVSFQYSAKDNECSYKWNESKRWKYKRVKISYIPAERNIVAAIPNWFEVSMNRDNVLDFMKEWEFARKTFTKEVQILDLPMKYKYIPSDKADRIMLPGGQDIDLSESSSGLQSLTPLYMLLRYLTREFYQQKKTNVQEKILWDNISGLLMETHPEMDYAKRNEIKESILNHHHTDFFIEEPESHIFPSTQKSFVYSLVKMLNGMPKHTCFIATHSPYIMTSFNNVILAGEKIAESKDNEEAIKKLMPKRQTLRYKEVAAFEMRNGRIYSIMDEEFLMISAESLDSASEEISRDFDNLLNI